jgi:hypothetical protein
LYQIDAQNWSFVVLNSLAKVSKNDVIIFEGLKISLKPFMGIHNTRHRVQWRDFQGGHCNALGFFFLWGHFIRLKQHAEGPCHVSGAVGRSGGISWLPLPW